MNFETIPAELRARRQWVVWRSVIVEGKITKPPYQARDPQYAADHSDPHTWGTFEEAVAAYQAAPSVISGIGYVFSEQDEFFGIDIDDEAKVKPEHLETRKQFVAQLLSEFDTYTEVSPSGNGVHIIGRGRLPVAGKRSTAMQVEIYCSMRYFTITGNVINGRNQIKDQQETLVSLFGALVPDNDQPPVADTDTFRRLDLSDEEVIRLATNFNPMFAPRFTAQLGCQPGEWSDTFMSVVGMIDRFTGSVEQVQRIIFNSPMVLNSPSSGGETRLHKAQRTLLETLRRVRHGNNGLMHFAEHGRQMVENLEKAKAERAKKAAEILEKANEAISGMSSGSKSVLEAFPQLTTEHKLLTRPPGIVGAFVEATEKASFKPFTKFAIPATLATLAGIVGRGFKLPGGSGLNVNFILAAPSNAGKTQTMKAWEKFVGEAADIIGNTPTGPSPRRIMNSSTSSIQAMMQDFMEVPSMAWFVEECYAQLTSMTEGRSPTEAHLRDSFNQLYDAGQHGSMFSGPRSIANKNSKIEPINNLCVSTYWTTTTSKFDVFSEDALDGFLSRVVVIRHHAPGGEPQQYPEDLPPMLRDILVQRLAAAKQIDETYRLSPFEAGKLLTIVSSAQVFDLNWEFIRICDAISNAAITGKLPPVYGAISRLPLTSMRVAGMMAVMENPFTPSITPEQYKWAFGYLLQNLVSLLTDVDFGDLGAGASDEVMAIVRIIKRMASKDKPGVPKQVLRDSAKHVKPFNEVKVAGIGPGRSKKVSDTLTYMLAENMIEEISISTGNVGRPTTFIAPVLSDPVWR